MRNEKKILIHIPPILPFFLGSTSLPNSPSPPPEWHRRTGNGGWGQFKCCLCRFFFLTLFSCSRVGSPSGVSPTGRSSPWNSPTWVLPMGCSSSCTAPPWVPSMGCSPLGTGCSTMGPPWGHKPCQQTCSSMGSSLHRSCQVPAPAWVLHRVTASFGHTPALSWGPSWATGGYLLHCGPPWAAEGQPASPWSSPWAAEESLLWCLERLLPLLLHWPWCLQSCFFHVFSLLPQLLLHGSFFVFLNVLSKKCYHLCWWAQPWPAAGLSWS